VYQRYGIDHFLKKIWKDWLVSKQPVWNASLQSIVDVDVTFQFVQADMAARSEIYQLPTGFGSQIRWCHVCDGSR
jgi:hypothetical protein